jgi:hypothetical protein
MSNKPGRDQTRVSRSLPHSSWNLDRPILLTVPDAAGEHRIGERRRVTPEEIWAIVDAAN